MTWQERHGEQYDRFPDQWTLTPTVDGEGPVIVAQATAGEVYVIDKRWQPPALGVGADVTLRCKMWFPADFPFDGGGKFVGLAGKDGGGVFDLAWGGSRPGDSWTARFLFGANGRSGIYLYAVSPLPATGDYGIGLWMADPGGAEMHYNAGWNDLELRCRMNTPGISDGWLRASLNGTLGVDRRNVQYRSDSFPDLGTSILLCFAGFGGDQSAAPSTDTTLGFADFALLTHQPGDSLHR